MGGGVEGGGKEEGKVEGGGKGAGVGGRGGVEEHKGGAGSAVSPLGQAGRGVSDAFEDGEEGSGGVLSGQQVRGGARRGRGGKRRGQARGPHARDGEDGVASGENSPEEFSNLSELSIDNLEAHTERMDREYEQRMAAAAAAGGGGGGGEGGGQGGNIADDGTDMVVMQRYYTLGRTRVSTLPLLNASDEVTKSITSRPTKGWKRTASRDSVLSRSSLSSIAESDCEYSLSCDSSYGS